MTGSRKALFRDVCLILLFIALSLVLFVVVKARSQEGSKVVVAVEGVQVGVFPLHVDGEYVLNGGTNVLLVKDSKAMIVDADCPDRLCMKQGAVCYTGQCITCLPNRLTVTVCGEHGGDGSVDIVI